MRQGTHGSVIRYRFILALIVAVTISSVAARPAAAARPDRFTSRTTSVFMAAVVPEQALSVYLFRHPGAGYEVCGAIAERSGCTVVAEEAVSLDLVDLTTATLVPTTVPLQSCDWQTGACTDAGTVTVAVTFRGTGELTHFKQRSTTVDSCTVTARSTGIQRQGEATITVDDTTYVEAVGFVSTSRDRLKVRCAG